MKKTKVLVPALGILCLSMAASITGTVAWFSANAQVTANGMRLSASTDTSLAISLENTGPWGNTVTLDGLVTGSVMPVSPLIYTGEGTTKVAGCTVANADSVGAAGVHHIDWYAKGADNQVVNPASPTAAVTFPSFASADDVTGDESTFVKEAAHSEDSNYAMDSAHIKLMAAAGTKQQVSCKIEVVSDSETGEKIDGAFHIGFLFKRNGASAVNNPTTGVAYGTETDATLTLSDKTFLNYDLTSFGVGAAGTDANAGHWVYSRLLEGLFKLEAEKPVEIVVYGWYEGEDPQCTSANATIVNNLTVNLSFEKYTA